MHVVFKSTYYINIPRKHTDNLCFSVVYLHIEVAGGWHVLHQSLYLKYNITYIYGKSFIFPLVFHGLIDLKMKIKPACVSVCVQIEWNHHPDLYMSSCLTCGDAIARVYVLADELCAY